MEPRVDFDFCEVVGEGWVQFECINGEEQQCGNGGKIFL